MQRTPPPARLRACAARTEHQWPGCRRAKSDREAVVDLNHEPPSRTLVFFTSTATRSDRVRLDVVRSHTSTAQSGREAVASALMPHAKGEAQYGEARGREP